MIAAMAWRNLWRRPQRTLLSLAGIVLVNALLVLALGFMDGVYGAMKETTLRILDGYAQIQAPGWAEDPDPSRILRRPQALTQIVRDVPGLNAAPRINAFAVLSHGSRSYAAGVYGVDPALEPRVSNLPRAIVQGRYLRLGDSAAAVIGEGLARNLDAHVGDQITLLGAGRDGASAADIVTVTGIYRTGIPELDRSVLEMPLTRAESVFSFDGALTAIAISGPSLAAVDRALPGLRTAIADAGGRLMDWRALEPALDEQIRLKYASALVFYFSLVAVVAFITLNTQLMSVLEREREFGVLLALGMGSAQVAAMVWLELLILAGLGAGLGMALAAAVSWRLGQVGVAIPALSSVATQFGMPSRFHPTVTPFSLFTGPGAIFLCLIIGGLAPWARVRRLTPADAVRTA